jgi:hypothetical protein
LRGILRLLWLNVADQLWTFARCKGCIAIVPIRVKNPPRTESDQAEETSDSGVCKTTSLQIASFDRALAAPRGHCVLTLGQEADAPFPAPLPPPAAFFLRFALDSLFLDEAEHFLHNRDASVATLSDGVRVHPGMPFGFPPESVFSFAGIFTFAGTYCFGKILYS